MIGGVAGTREDDDAAGAAPAGNTGPGPQCPVTLAAPRPPAAGAPGKVKQPLVSKFLIGRWADSTGKVEVFDLRRWGPVRAAPAAICFVRSDASGKGFVPLEHAAGLEQEWGAIESSAAQALAGDVAELAADPARRRAVLDLIALHLVRSSEMRAAQIEIVASLAAKTLDDAQKDPRWGQILKEVGMSRSEGLRTVDAFLRDRHGGFVPSARSDTAGRLPHFLGFYREQLERCGLRVCRPKRAGGFMLGDGPAFLSASTRPGRLESTALFGRLIDGAGGVLARDDAWYAHMPLGPRFLAVAGPHVTTCRGVIPLSGDVVRRANVVQCARSQFRVVIPLCGADSARRFVKQHAAPTPDPACLYPFDPPDPGEKWRH